MTGKHHFQRLEELSGPSIKKLLKITWSRDGKLKLSSKAAAASVACGRPQRILTTGIIAYVDFFQAKFEDHNINKTWVKY